MPGLLGGLSGRVGHDERGAMSEALATGESVIARAAKMADLPAALERAVIAGDLTYLTVEDRVKFYSAVCNSLGLNPLTRPFQYVQLNQKLTLYATKDCADQLRKLHRVSVTKVEKEFLDDGALYVVTAYGTDRTARTDAATGVVSLFGKRGEDKANAMMKAETKAKRRLTLSLCGLGIMDETDVEAMPGEKVMDTTIIPEAEVIVVVAPPPPPPVERDPDKPPTAAEAATNGWAQLQERMKSWPPEIAAIIPPDEATYLMPADDAEANRTLYATGIRDMVKRRKLSTQEKAELRVMFFGSPTAQLDSANIYVLRAMWRHLDPERE